MDTKLKSAISRIQQERARGNHAKAAKRAADALGKYPDSLQLYDEAIGASLDAAESLQAIGLLKKAFARLPEQRSQLMGAARERVTSLGDTVVGKFLLEETIRRRELREARAIVGEFTDRTARDLLQRTRMKRSTLASAARGGHTVDDETKTNTISDAVLSARLGRPDEAAKAAAQALDDHADDADALAGLLEDIVEEHAGCALASFVLARCLHAVSRHAEATERLIHAVRTDPELGPDGLELLRNVGAELDDMPESIERASLEILLVTGQFDRAAEVARPWLDRSDDDAGTVVDAIAAFAGRGAINDLHRLLLDAALRADRANHVHETLVALVEEADNHAPVLEWFDSNEERVFSPDIELIRATLLIDDERYDDAARALKALCVASSADIPRVSALLAPHRGKHDALDRLADEINTPRESAAHAADIDIAPPAPAPEPGANPDVGGAAFESFENTEFRFSANDDNTAPAFDVSDGPGVIALGDEAPAGDFNIFDGSNILGGGDNPRPTAPRKSAYAGGRRPLDNDRAGILWEEEGEGAQTEAPATEENPAMVDEDFVRNVSDSLYQSGAATFFHIDDGTAADDPADEPAASSVDEPPADDPAAEPVDEEPPSFADRFSRFQDGHLDGDDVVELMEEAARDGRVEELGQLVECSSSTDGHELRRGLCGAEYELLRGRPARALEHLKAIRNLDMTEDQRKDTWLKTVACQRKMQDFDAAHQTLLQLVTLYPDCPEVARVAQQNYREYLQTQCTEAPVLEKVTSLDGDT